MFVERLLATLHAPHSQLGILDEALPLDSDRLRALLVYTARSRAAAGLLSESTVEWLFRLVAEGWIDDHLQLVRDALLELGAAQGLPGAELDRLLEAAVRHLTGESPQAGRHGLTHADVQLLLAAEQCAQPGSADAALLGLRLLARRYALALGLIAQEERQEQRAGGPEPERPAPVRRTPLGDAALRLPRQQLLSFLLSLEVAQSTGALGVLDRFCTPRRVLRAMFERRRFLVATSTNARRRHDPDELFPWRSIRRLHLLGVIEPVVSREDGALGAGPDEPREVYLYRLTHVGAAALGEALREPASELLQLATALSQERCERALRPLILRTQARLTPIAIEAVAPPSPPSLLRATELPSEVLRQSVAQHVELPAGALDRWLPEARPTSSSGAPRTGERGPDPADEDVPRLLRLVPGSGPETAPQELELGKLIQRAWEDLQVQRVRFSLHGPGARAVADRRALLQGWRELLRATADAALQGGHGAAQVAIEVTSSGDSVLALVHDNGPPLVMDPLGPEVEVDEAPELAEPAQDERMQAPLPAWLATGARAALWRAQRALAEQGAVLSLLPPQLGGLSLRIVMPRLPRLPRSARTAA